MVKHGSHNLLHNIFLHQCRISFSFMRVFTPSSISFSQSAQKIKEENGGGTIVNVNDGEEGSLEADEKETLEAFLPMAKKQQVGAKANGECTINFWLYDSGSSKQLLNKFNISVC